MRRGGPVAAVVAGLRTLALGDDLEHWGPSVAAPRGWGPLERPWPETSRVLLRARGAKECRDAAGRRADMARIAVGIDRYDSMRLLNG
eukprot:4113030-Lingulodinium_polyedra.AAC.1